MGRPVIFIEADIYLYFIIFVEGDIAVLVQQLHNNLSLKNSQTGVGQIWLYVVLQRQSYMQNVIIIITKCKLMGGNLASCTFTPLSHTTNFAIPRATESSNLFYLMIDVN